MARTNNLSNFLTDVADAIRTKKGSEELIAAEDFDTEIENLPSGGSNPTTIEELNQYAKNVFDSYTTFLENKVSSYDVYTEDPVVLYTPDLDCKTYMIHKRSNGKYRIIWANQPYVEVRDTSTLSFCLLTVSSFQTVGGTTIPKANLAGSVEKIKTNMFDIILINGHGPGGNTDFTIKTYYSNEFDSIDDLIAEVKKTDGNLEYTSWTTGLGFAGVIDTPYKIPYTNTNVFDATDNNALLMSQRISANETYALKS